MSQHYHTYATYGVPNLQTSASLSGSPSNGLPQQALAPAQRLPPLSNTTHGPANTTLAYANQHPTMMTPRSAAVDRAGNYSYVPAQAAPVYGPTGNTLYQFYQGNSGGGYADTPQRQQQPEPSRSPPTHIQSQSQPQQAYPTTTRSLPEIAPMPPRTTAAQGAALGSSGDSNQNSQQQTPHTHVVGAQGRRGILPSDPGRPAAVVGTDLQGSKNLPLPPKNTDGKYPCPYCEKTYLHSKHLKRHLLRHNGTRPYSCGLCADTFSRSDILKRHFQKCSSRRGNPTGQSHLAHSRANKQWREQKEAQDRESMESGTPTISDMPSQSLGNYTPTSAEAPFDLNTLNLSQINYSERSARVSRANSVTRSGRSNDSQSNRASLGMVAATSGYESVGYAHSAGHDTPDSITTSGAATPYTYTHEARTSQLPGHDHFPHTANGDLAFSSSSRPPTSSSYHQASLPHILGQGNAREYQTDWSSYALSPHDEYGNGQHHSGTSTPFEREKPNGDIPPLFQGFMPYNGPKV